VKGLLQEKEKKEKGPEKKKQYQIQKMSDTTTHVGGLTNGGEGKKNGEGTFKEVPRKECKNAMSSKKLGALQFLKRAQRQRKKQGKQERKKGTKGGKEKGNDTASRKKTWVEEGGQ